MKKNLLILFCMVLLNCGTTWAQSEKRVFVDKAGTLISYFTEQEANEIVHLTITGKINAIDFRHLRDGFKNLEILDISNAQIRMYAGNEGTSTDKFHIYPVNCIPAYAFCKIVNEKLVGKQTLTKVILSEKTRNIESGAFMGCENLKICQVKKKTPPELLADALADSITAIFVPNGSRDEYRFQKRWENFAILEGEPVTASLEIGVLETLKDKIQESGLQPKSINYLTITGKLDDADFRLLQDYLPNLVSLNIQNTTATSIPDFTFSQKRYLMDIKLPKELKTIGQRAFSNCERLSGNLLLPITVTSIDYGAFMGCTNLKKVIVTGNMLTTLGENIFGDDENKLIYRK